MNTEFILKNNNKKNKIVKKKFKKKKNGKKTHRKQLNMYIGFEGSEMNAVFFSSGVYFSFWLGWLVCVEKI